MALTLLVLRATDLEQTRQFYEALGLSFTLEQHDPGPRHYSSKLGDTVLEIYPLAAPPTGIRFGMSVDDVDGAVEAVRAMGGSVVRVEVGKPLRNAIVRDPDGNTVELSTKGGAPSSRRN
jgi:catechol 2,3-dioxygenase-like lactoylglutathione lyase family enzyme